MAPPVSPQARLKISLKMAISRLRFIQTKQTALAKQQRRSMADLLNQGKESSAKIRVENIIRDDIYVELLEFLELYCELLLARIGLLDQKECDPGLEEAVKTIIYCAPHTDIKEIMSIREILVHKFGAEFAKAAIDNDGSVVLDKITSRCVVKAPSEVLVNLYLTEIAKAYHAPFSEMQQLAEEEDVEDDDDDDDGEGGTAIEVLEEPILAEDDVKPSNTQRRLSSTLDLPDPNASNSPISVKPPHKTIDNLHPQVKVPDGVSVRKKKPENSKKKEQEEFDELKKRFENLRKK